MESSALSTHLQRAINLARVSNAAKLASSKQNSIPWEPKGQEFANYVEGFPTANTALEILHQSCVQIYTDIREINGRFAPKHLCQGCFHSHGKPNEEQSKVLLRVLRALVPDGPNFHEALHEMGSNRGGLKLRRCEVARVIFNAISRLRWARQVAAYVVHNRNRIFLLRETESAVTQLFTPALNQQAQLLFGSDWFERIRKGFVEFAIDDVQSLFRQMEYMADGNGKLRPDIKRIQDLKSPLVLTLSYRHLIKRINTRRKNTYEVNQRIANLIVSAARALADATGFTARSSSAKKIYAYVWIDVFYCTTDDGKWDNEALMPYALFPVVYFRRADLDRNQDSTRMWLAIENVIAKESGLIFTNVGRFDEVWESEKGLVQGKVFKRPDVAVYTAAKWIGAHAARLHTHHPTDKEKLMRWTLRTALTGIWPGMWEVSDSSGTMIERVWFGIQHDYGEIDLVSKLGDSVHGLGTFRDACPIDSRWWKGSDDFPCWNGLETANSRVLVAEQESEVVSVMMDSFKTDYEKKTPFDFTLSIEDDKGKLECVVFLRAWARDGLLSDGIMGIVKKETSRMVCRKDLSRSDLSLLAECFTTEKGHSVTLLDIEKQGSALEQIMQLDLSSMWKKRSLSMDINVSEGRLVTTLSRLIRDSGYAMAINNDGRVDHNRYTEDGERKMMRW